MSGGHFEYLNDEACDIIFSNARCDYRIGDEYYKNNAEKARALDPLEDKEISELVFDVFCLLHSLDYYICGDRCKDDYQKDKNIFKQKWMNQKRTKTMNFEQFNAAMCALRQAEEDFNKALGDVFRAINDAAQDTETEDFRIGDEVMVVERTYDTYGRTGIIVSINKHSTEECLDFIHIIDSDTFHFDAYFPSDLRKTGKHYDSIPLTKEETNK